MEDLVMQSRGGMGRTRSRNPLNIKAFRQGASGSATGTRFAVRRGIVKSGAYRREMKKKEERE
jgi:hypothetical protein